MTMLDEVRFWAIVRRSQARTVVCSPEMESRVKTMIDARGLPGTYKVVVSPGCPDTAVYMIDEGAIEAATNEALSKPPRIWP